MKKRILTLAMLATIAYAPVVARAEYKPDWESIGIERTWEYSAGVHGTAATVNISRQENESEYAYYNRIRELLLSEFTLVSNVPTSTEEAIAMGQNKQLSGDMLMNYMVRVVQERSDIHCSVHYMQVNGSLYHNSTNRSTEMVNEFGQTQTVLSKEIYECSCTDTWREKGVFGAVKLDGNLYAIKIGTDASDWATLIPYTDLGCRNCIYDLTWNYNILHTRQYESAGKSTLGDYYLEVYNSDGTLKVADIQWKTGSTPWEIQGVSQYYCENGVIKPMTEALHNTLPNNKFIVYYPLGLDKAGARRFIE